MQTSYEVKVFVDRCFCYAWFWCLMLCMCMLFAVALKCVLSELHPLFVVAKFVCAIVWVTRRRGFACPCFVW